MIETIAWIGGITGVSFAVASAIKSLCGDNKTCKLHGGVLERLKLGDTDIELLNKGMVAVREGVARIEGKLEMIIKNLK